MNIDDIDLAAPLSDESKALGASAAAAPDNQELSFFLNKQAAMEVTKKHEDAAAKKAADDVYKQQLGEKPMSIEAYQKDTATRTKKPVDHDDVKAMVTTYEAIYKADLDAWAKRYPATAQRELDEKAAKAAKTKEAAEAKAKKRAATSAKPLTAYAALVSDMKAATKRVAEIATEMAKYHSNEPGIVEMSNGHAEVEDSPAKKQKVDEETA